MLKYIKNIIIVATVFISTACSDLLVTEPKQSISTDVALKDITGVRALLISVYDRLQPAAYYGQRVMIAPDILADNVRLTNTNSNRYFNERVNAPSAHMQQFWANYAGINEANFIIKGIDGANTTAAEKAQIKAEALFLRALLYFDMARVFCYMPKKVVNGFNEGMILRTEPTDDVDKADFRPRSTIEETYQLIEKDLKESITLFPATGNRLRANKAAANALLARVYLYWEKYTEAATAATAAIDAPNGATFVTGANYASAFTSAPNPESFFEINYVQATEGLGVNESMHSLTTNLTSGNWADVVPTNELLALYEATDIRRTAGFYAGTKGGEPVFFSRKFTASRGPFTDNTPVIRFSEVLLIRAEAYAMTNREDLALADLNRIRVRAAASPVPATTKGDALIDAIMRERRLELVLEGHRFFDLKRRGQTITKAGLSAPVPFTDFRILAPIPTSQVQLNNKLKQNPGY
jgi:starch-binding outer membrane protein, SusD/RagB family